MPATATTSAIKPLPHSNGSARLTPRFAGAPMLEALRDVATYAAYEHHDEISVESPFSGEVVGSVPAGTPRDMEEAFARARSAQRSWAERPIEERAAVLIRLHDAILEQQDEILDLIQMESGKARIHAFEEILDVAMVARYYGYHGARILRRERRPGAIPILTRTEVNHVPVGVVGIICPWNYPLSMAITDALPALLAGNAVVLKPAEQTPFTALWIARLARQCGLPNEVLHVVPGRGRDIGSTLIKESDYVHFTGSTEVGRLVATQAAERLIGCSLELGGKNPMIVLDDADLDRAADGAIRGCFASAGQLCISAERLYVHEDVREPFLQRLSSRIAGMRIRASYRYDSDMGALVSQEQFDKVTDHVQDALSKGARALTGGRPMPEAGALFYAPTVLTGVTPEMKVYREETFGPVVSVYSFERDSEAVYRANDSRFGLNASVWTGNAARGLAIARRLQAGTVNINEAYIATWGSMAAPMGGFKSSGNGRRHGPEGIRKYTEAQTVSLQRLVPIAVPRGVEQSAFTHMAGRALQLLRRVPGLR